MKLFDGSNLVSWEHCIEANRVCNLQNCPDTMNCCVSNCIAMPTLQGFLVFGGIALILFLAFRIWCMVREPKGQ